MTPANCPSCRSDMRGNPVPMKYRVHQDDCAEQKARWDGRCFCLPYGDTTHFNRVIGMEMRGVYDGVLFWRCPDCDHAWPRFAATDRLAFMSRRYADEYNARGAA